MTHPLHRTVNHYRQLLERVQASRAHFRQEIAAEQQLFEFRFVGDTSADKVENFNRWIAQHAKVVAALEEYDAATREYLAAITEK